MNLLKTKRQIMDDISVLLKSLESDLAIIDSGRVKQGRDGIEAKLKKAKEWM